MHKIHAIIKQNADFHTNKMKTLNALYTHKNQNMLFVSLHLSSSMTVGVVYRCAVEFYYYLALLYNCIYFSFIKWRGGEREQEQKKTEK